MKNRLLLRAAAALLFAASCLPCRAQSIARTWDDECLNAIRIDIPKPPVHARNLYHLSVAMYDAWAAYQPGAVGYIYHGKHTAGDVAAARREAISYAAWRILKERYALSVGSATSLAALDNRLTALGYSTSNHVLDNSPAGVGNKVAAAVSSFFLNDGARQTANYADFSPAQGGYVSRNTFTLLVSVSGTLANEPNYWQPMAITDATTQNGIPADSIQKFIGAHWRDVTPFALTRNTVNGPWIDPGPPPRLGTATDQEYKDTCVAVIRAASQLTPDDGVNMDISPGATGNNPLGLGTGTGHAVNPATGQPYAANVVKRGDFARVLAEFWADGPTSETPPGHWNTLANYVSDNPLTVKRIGATGPIVDALEWDVKLYFAMNASLHDAACAAWTLKRHYDGWRPMTAIRYMGQLGQCTDPELSSYHPQGLPLVPGLIEIVTAETAQEGQRHFGLFPGTIAILNWPGQPADPATQHSGVKWIAAYDFRPYQRRTFVTPAFPGYVSGHSTFSRAAAEVLTSFTGSAFFPGGLGIYNVPQNTYLAFERGPSQAITLQWGTYYDAADQAGLSRIWGGIHPPADDFSGRIVGAQAGKSAWSLAMKYFDGTITSEPMPAPDISVNQSTLEFRCTTLRGLQYKLQSSTTLAGPWADESAEYTRATGPSLVLTATPSGPRRFYRVMCAAVP